MLPGAGQALMLRQTLHGGPVLARPAIMGTATGLLLWSAGAAAGISALLLADPRAYAIVRVLGGLVLALIGVATLRSSRRPHEAAPDAPHQDTRGWGACAAGLGTNLGNPKAGVFAISTLPQFVTDHGPVWASTLALGALRAVVTSAWYLLFTTLVDRGRALVSRPTVQRGIHIVAGIVLLVLGGAVATGG